MHAHALGVGLTMELLHCRENHGQLLGGSSILLSLFSVGHQFLQEYIVDGLWYILKTSSFILHCKLCQ